MYINTQLNLFKIASLLVSLYYMSAADASISILGSSDGVNYLDIVKDTISPPYSNFIGAQYNSPLCNIPSLDLVQTVAVDASTNQLKINNLCFGFGKEINPELKAAVKGKALLIPDIVDGFGACSIEHKYLKLINDFEVAAIISVSEGVPGVRMNAHDGSRGANTLGDSYPPLLEITIPNKDQLQIIKKATSLKVQIKNCDISPWKEVFEGPVWMTLNVINAILYFFVSFIAARNIVLFRQRQRAGSKISKDINVIYVILVFIVGGSVTMAFVFALGFAYSTPLINFGSAQAFISMLSGVSIFPLFLNALYFREYSLSVMKIRQPRNVFQCYKKSIIAGAIVFLGVDTFRQITASFYYSVGTVPASAFYLLSNLFVAASFLYESEKFIRHIRNSVRANNDAKRESKSMASQISSAVSDLTSRFTKDGKNVHANSESGSIKATRSKHGESLQKKREDPLKKFIQKMAYWLRFCALFQILWLGSLPLIVLGYIKIPQGNLIFGVLMSIARFGTTYCQARALSPHSYQGKSSSSSGEDGSASSPKKEATSKEGHLSISSTSPKSKVSKNESKVSDNVSPSKSFILNAKSSSKGILPATSASNPESLADSQSGSRNNSKVSMVVIPSPTNAPDPKANSAKIEALTRNDIEIEGAQFVLDEQDD